MDSGSGLGIQTRGVCIPGANLGQDIRQRSVLLKIPLCALSKMCLLAPLTGSVSHHYQAVANSFMD